VREARAGEADEVEEDGEALVAAAVVARGKPDGELAHVRVAERVVLEDARDVLEHDDAAGVAFRALEGHLARDRLEVGVAGEAAGLAARIDEPPVDRDVELADAAGLDLDRAAAARFEPGLHTEGLRLVASVGAVADQDLHG
jgi:hypothetical protein